MTGSGHSKYYLAALLALIVLYTVANAVWLVLDTQPPHSDSVFYIQGSYEFYKRLQAEGVRGLAAIPDLVLNRPPMQSLVGAVVLPFVEWRPDGVVFVNAIWLSLAVWFTFLVGRKLAGPACGFLAAVFLMTDPYVHAFLPHFETEIPLMAGTAACLWLAIRILEEGRRRDFAALGALVATGLLFKWLFAVIVAGALAYTVFYLLRYGPLGGTRAGQKGFRNWWRDLGILLAFPAILALPWYIHYLPGLLIYHNWVSKTRFFTPFDEGWTFVTLWYYPSLAGLRLKGFHLLFLLTGIVAAILFIRRQDRQNERKLLFLILASLLFFWLFFVIQYKNLPQKYFLPLQPLLAVMAGTVATLLPDKSKVWAIAGFSAAMTLIFSNGQWNYPAWISTTPSRAIDGPWMERQTGLWAYDLRVPRKSSISHETIVETIARAHDASESPPRVFVLPVFPSFSFYTLSIWLQAEFGRSECAGFSKQDNLPDVVFHDYFVLSRGPVYPGMVRKDRISLLQFRSMVKLARMLDSPSSHFYRAHRKIGEVRFDKTVPLEIYQRTVDPTPAEAAEWIGLLIDEVIQFPMWIPMSKIWERLQENETLERSKDFQRAIQRKDAQAIHRLMEREEGEIAAWHPYERYLLGVLALREKQIEKAMTLFQSLADSSCTVPAGLRLADLFLRAGRTEDAISVLMRAWSLQLYEPGILERMAKAYEKDGQTELADFFQSMQKQIEQLAHRNDQPQLFQHICQLLRDYGFNYWALLYENELARHANGTSQS